PVVGKTFVDCEIVGPAVVLLTGGSYLTKCNLGGNDFVEIVNPAKLHNVVVLDGASFTNCEFIHLTILVDENFGGVPEGANWITARRERPRNLLQPSP